MKRLGLAVALAVGGCHLIFGLEDPTLGEPSAQNGAGAGSTSVASAGGAGGTGGSGGSAPPCTEAPCAVWSESLGHLDMSGDVIPTTLATSAAGEILVGGEFAGTIEVGGLFLTTSSGEGFVLLVDEQRVPRGLTKIGGSGRPASAAKLGDVWAVSGGGNGTITMPDGCVGNTTAGLFYFVLDETGLCTASQAHPTGIGTSAVLGARDTDVWLVGTSFAPNVSLGGACLTFYQAGTPAADMFVAHLTGPTGACTNVSVYPDSGALKFSGAGWPPMGSPGPRTVTVTDAVAFNMGSGDTVDGGPGAGVLMMYENEPGTPRGALEFLVGPDNGLRAMRSAVAPNDGTIWALVALEGSVSYDSNYAGGFDYAASSRNGVDSALFQYSDGGSIVSMMPTLIAGEGEQRGESMAVDSQGNVYVAGWFNGTINLGEGVVASNGDTDAFVMKFSASGTLLWGVRWGDANAQAATHVAVLPNDHVVVAGSYEGTIDFGGQQHQSNMAKSTFVVELDPELP